MNADRLNGFLESKTAQVAAFLWGIAEATVFFIVPDVLLSAIGCRSIRKGLKATALAILGAIIGGTIMYFVGQHSLDQSQAFLTRIPAIHPQLVERVQTQLSTHGLLAVIIGPTEGIPYKIYATEWGIRHGNLFTFLLITIPARGVRFLLSVFVANGIARLAQPWTKRRTAIEMTILIIFWIVFYLAYFSLLGW